MGTDFKKRLAVGIPMLFIVGILVSYQNCGKLKDAGMPIRGGTAQNSTSPTSTPSATPKPNMYKATVLADGPSYYWRLGESSGNTLVDIVGGNNATITGVFSLNIPGALFGDTDTAISTNDQTVMTTSLQVADPLVFSEELWFRSTTGAGKLIGFGNLQSGSSTNYDRQIYLTDTGQVYFGVYTTTTTAVGSANSYLDNQWHHVVGTFTATVGLRLYVDGVLVGQTGPISTNNATGYVRLGYDSCSGWPNAPSDCHFVGSLDEIAIYPVALSATQVLNHYNAGVNK